MKQLILKELREQFKVALIGLALLSVLLFLGFASYGRQLRELLGYGAQQGSGDQMQPLMRTELLIQVAYFCGLFGTLLGWLQIRAEQHPDLWAFLIHRPVQRTKILQSKVVAGLLLYLAGAGFPLLGLVLAVSIPGMVAAPFAWEMALPLASIFLVGLVHYFAGLLTGLRKARWFASRGMGVGLAVCVTIAVFAVPEFWQALLIVLVTGAVLAQAVWGTFQAGGFYRDQPASGKVALALVGTVACAVVMGVAFAFIANLLAWRGDFTHTHYQIARDGKVLRITQRGHDDADITDETGQPLLDEQTGQKLRAKDLQQRFAYGVSVMADADVRTSVSGRHRAGFFRYTRFFSPWTTENKTLWFLTTDGRLVGYDALTRRQVGTLVPRGTADTGAADDSHFLMPNHFAYAAFRDWARPIVLASARTAYRVDLEKQELHPLLTAPSGNRIVGFANWPAPGTQKGNIALILTQTTVNHLDIESGVTRELPYLPAAPAYPQVTVYWLEPTNTLALRFDPAHAPRRAAGSELLPHVKWINADGSIRAAKDLPKLPEIAPTGSTDRFLIPLLPPAIPFWTWEGPYRLWHLLRLIPALVCVGAGWWLGRRNHFSAKAQAAWALHHLLFGLPGFLAFLAVQEWSAQEPCPSCHQPRAVDREQCDHCHADFAPPEKTGTEIFAPLTRN